MPQALVVSDNEVLSGLYSVNLEGYLGTSSSVQESSAQAIKLLELNSNFDLIITLCLIDGNDVALEIQDFLKREGLDIPMLVVGKQSDIKESDCVILPASFNIRSLVRASARILGITAKDMVTKPVPHFYPIPIRLFFNLDKVNCDIFYRVKKSKEENEHLLILPKGGRVWPRIKKYMDEGVRNLYVDSDERLNFINSASEQLVEVLENEQGTTEEKIDALEQGIEISTEHLLNSEEASDEIVRISKACVKTVSQVVKAVPKLNNLLSKMLANKSGYLYSHSMVTTYVANHIVRNISWGGESHLEKLNFVLFFHDMFLVQIYNRYPHLKYEEDLLFNDELSEQEKEVVLNHAKLAGEIIHKFPQCPMGADQLIKQHHGVTNGVGFAVRYRDDISPLAKLILIAEHFTEEIFKAMDEGRTFSKQFVIAMLKERYGKSSYNKIVEHLESIEI